MIFDASGLRPPRISRIRTIVHRIMIEATLMTVMWSISRSTSEFNYSLTASRFVYKKPWCWNFLLVTRNVSKFSLSSVQAPDKNQVTVALEKMPADGYYLARIVTTGAKCTSEQAKLSYHMLAPAMVAILTRSGFKSGPLTAYNGWCERAVPHKFFLRPIVVNK